VEEGEYEILVASSSPDIRLQQKIYVCGSPSANMPNYRNTAPVYYQADKIAQIPKEQFEVLLESKVPPNEKYRKPHTPNTTLANLAGSSAFMKFLVSVMEKQVLKQMKDDEETRRPAEVMFMDMPIRAICMSGGMSKRSVEGIVDILNGHFIKGFKKMKQKSKYQATIYSLNRAKE